jgi:hypothetical protein
MGASFLSDQPLLDKNKGIVTNIQLFPPIGKRKTLHNRIENKIE